MLFSKIDVKYCFMFMTCCKTDRDLVENDFEFVVFVFVCGYFLIINKMHSHKIIPKLPVSLDKHKIHI